MRARRGRCRGGVRPAALAFLTLAALASAGSLGRLDPSDVHALLEQRLATDPDDGVRSAAARLLAPSGHPEALAFLRIALAEEPSGLGRYEDALGGLASSPDDSDRTLVIEAIDTASTPILRAKAAGFALALDVEAAHPVVARVLADPDRPREARLARSAAAPLAASGLPGAFDTLADAYLRYGADSQAGPALARALFSLDVGRAEGLVLEAARGSRWTQRKAACSELPRLGRERAAPVLAGLFLGDAHDQVRQAALEGLMRVDPVQAGQLATEVLADTTRPVVFRAFLADTLALLGWTPAEPILLEIFAGDEGMLWVSATRALGAIRSAAALPGMLAILAEREGPDVGWRRTWCARALAFLPDPAATEALAGTLREDPEPHAVHAAATSLARHASDAAWRALQLALASELPEATRLAAAGALGRHEASTHALTRVLVEDPSAAVRERAARSIGLLEIPERRDALLGALADPEAAVRRAAFEMLSRRAGWALAGEERALEALGRHPDPAVRMGAAMLLKAAGTVAARDGLVRGAYQDSDRNLRVYCHQALETLDPDAAAAASREALVGDPDAVLRVLAARRVGRLDPAGGFAELRAAALRDEDARVRRAAVLGLAGLVGGASHAVAW